MTNMNIFFLGGAFSILVYLIVEIFFIQLSIKLLKSRKQLMDVWESAIEKKDWELCAICGDVSQRHLDFIDEIDKWGNIKKMRHFKMIKSESKKLLESTIKDNVCLYMKKQS